MFTCKGKKSPLWDSQRRFEPMTLLPAGQWVQHITKLFQPTLAGHKTPGTDQLLADLFSFRVSHLCMIFRSLLLVFKVTVIVGKDKELLMSNSLLISRNCVVFILFLKRKISSIIQFLYRGFPTRMLYLYYVSCLRYTILVRNPWYSSKYCDICQSSVILRRSMDWNDTMLSIFWRQV